MRLKISRILHAGYLLECENTKIAFDPIFETPFSRNCFAFPEVRFDHGKIKKLKLDAVFISHYHDDHCSLESLDLLDRATPIYLYCVFDELYAWIRELGFRNVHSLQINKSVNIGAFEVIPRRALDADVDSIFHIRASGLNVLNVVDSWIDPDTLELLRETKWDMVLWPFQTMREIEVLAPEVAEKPEATLPPEWTEQLGILKPRFVVPSACQFKMESWSWYNQSFFPVTYRQFVAEVGNHVVRINPGVSVWLNQTGLSEAEPLDFIIPVGDQNVDFEFVPGGVPPATAEMATHFAPLSTEETKRVLEFCRGLTTEKNWQLSVFDHNGAVTDFIYENKGPLWRTEIPVARLYGALANGESLTSLYVRIFPVVEADVLEDPLLSALFTGEFGTYQKAQLKRIYSARRL